MLYTCEACGGILEVAEPAGTRVPAGSFAASTMWKYADTLAVTDAQHVVSLGEGMTPLHRAARLEQHLPNGAVTAYIKDETVNPTGSFKDRLVSAAVSKAVELGCKAIVCASSGNAGASAAAYAAKAGLKAIIVAPARTPAEKLTQISAYGAEAVLIDGHYSYSYRFAELLAEKYGYANVTTTYLNPYGTNALKVVGYELFEQLGGNVPDYVFIPCGSGPLVKGVYQGFREITRARAAAGGGAAGTGGEGGRVPKLVAVQAEGCAPVVRAYEAGERTVTAWDEPRTIASGISDPLIGYEQDGTYTLELVRASGGAAVAVSDDEIVEAMRLIARTEAVLAEPTGASSVAALMRMLRSGAIPPGSTAVCMVTGHGFKDFKVVREMNARYSAPVHRLQDPQDEAETDRLLRALANV
jgi:threonine synthase